MTPAPATSTSEAKTIVRVQAPIAEREISERPEEPSVESQLDALGDEVAVRVRERAMQICKTGPMSPAWSAALAIARRDVLRIGGLE
jgi:hypothetical protein